MKNIIEKTIINSPTNFRILNQKETSLILNKNNETFELFKNCTLAVLCIDEATDEPDVLKNKYTDFDINLIQTNRGIKLELLNAPASSFVDGKIIQGVKEHIFSVLRDILQVHNKIDNKHLPFDSSYDITNSIFNILRNTNVMIQGNEPNLVVCWGGHSISRNEYEYTKSVGYQLGLRGLDICTGCGMGAMKGPMKGAAIAHLKTRKDFSKFVGLSEPGIISSEAPNPLVNNLIIMPDIEKRLEAFVRLAHGIVIFPGGPGTAEELLYLIGLLLHPKNKNFDFPIVFSCSEDNKDYIYALDQFIKDTIGEEGASKYSISHNAEETAKIIEQGITELKESRYKNDESFHYNWNLNIDYEFQKPFPPIHDEIKKLEINMNIPKHILAANLRRIFSVIVAGNIKPDGVNAIKNFGPFQINGDKYIMDKLDILLESFVLQNRMKLPSDKPYNPCYKIV